jgi:hypothetical protein
MIEMLRFLLGELYIWQVQRPASRTQKKRGIIYLTPLEIAPIISIRRHANERASENSKGAFLDG